MRTASERCVKLCTIVSNFASFFQEILFLEQQEVHCPCGLVLRVHLIGVSLLRLIVQIHSHCVCVEIEVCAERKLVSVGLRGGVVGPA